MSPCLSALTNSCGMVIPQGDLLASREGEEILGEDNKPQGWVVREWIKIRVVRCDTGLKTKRLRHWSVTAILKFFALASVSHWANIFCLFALKIK